MWSLTIRALATLSAAIGVAASPLAKNGEAIAARQTDYEGYMFAYFTGNTIDGEKIYFAASNGNNALDWQELNGGQPVITSTMGTKGLRDPFVMRSVDGCKFYLLATDLSIGSGSYVRSGNCKSFTLGQSLINHLCVAGTSWDSSVRNGSRYLEIWESKDLIDWGQQRHVLVSPPTAGNTWAPEAHWDDKIGSYAVYWASSLYAEDDTDHTGSTYHRMLYATTQDFITFSEPQIWQDTGTSRIDTDILQVEDTYYRFTKDEGNVTGCVDIIQESSQDLLAQVSGWKTMATCIGKKAGTSAIEGPTAFRSNPGDTNGDKFYLFVDEYGDRGYIPLETADVSAPNWTVSTSYSLPTSPRHGTVLPITAEELQRLTSSQLTE